MYSAVRPDGTDVHAMIGARDLAEARRILEERGFREIRFPIEPMPDLDGRGAREKMLVTPGQPLWRIVGPNSLFVAAMIAWSAWELAHDGDMLWNVAWIVGSVLLWVFIVVPAAVYPALRQDRAWGRWAAMGQKARFLQLTSGVLRLRFVRSAMDFELARALAGLGRLPEALAVVVRYRDGTPEQRHFYLGQVVSVYEIAGDFDAALGVARESVGLSPNDAAPRLDLAMRHALRFHDAPSARAELERLGPGELSQLAEAFRQFVLGVILLEEGAWLEAHASLDAARSAIAAMPAMPGLMEGVRAHRAWAMAGLGRFEEAERELGEVSAMLEAGDRWMAEHIESRIAALRPSSPALRT